MRKRLISMLVIACMLVGLMPGNVLAANVPTENPPDQTSVIIEQGQLDVPAGCQDQVTYPIEAMRILDDGTNFFDSPMDGWYLLDGDIFDSENISSNLTGYNLILRSGAIGGNDGSWYWDDVNLWGMTDTDAQVSISDVWIDGTGFSVNSGNVLFENAVINCPGEVNGGKVTLDASSVGTSPLRVTNGQLNCAQLGRSDMEWTGDIAIDGGYVTIGEVVSFGGNFSAGDQATVLVSTSEDDSRFDNIPKGIVFKGNKGIVKGNVTLIDDYQVKNGRTLVVPKDSVLTVGENVTLTNNGNIQVAGQLDTSKVNATVVGNPVEQVEPKPPVIPDEKPSEPVEPPTPVYPPYIPPTPVPPVIEPPVIEPPVVEPPVVVPKDPIYVVPDVSVAPLYGIGGNIGMTETQQDVAGQVLKDTVDSISKKDQNDQSQLEKDIADSLKNGEQLTIKLQTEKLRDKYVEDDKKVIENMEKQLGENFNGISWQLVDVFHIKAIADESGSMLGEIQSLNEGLPFTVLLSKAAPCIYEKASLDENKRKYSCAYGIVKFKDDKIEFLSPDDFYGDDTSKSITFNVHEMATYGVFSYNRQAPKLNYGASRVSGVKVYKGKGKLKVTFNKVVGADGYRVYVRDIRTGKKWKVYNVSKNTITLRKIAGKPISSRGKYQIKVSAVFNISCHIPMEHIKGDKVVDGYLIRKGKESYLVRAYKESYRKKI